MSADPKGKKEEDERKPVTVNLPMDIVETLAEFCRTYRVTADTVVERALADYFREGDMSH